MNNIQENLGAEPNKDDFVLISDEVVRAKINAQLEYITARQFLTPYVGLEAVRKILAYQNLFIPNTVFLDRTSGYDIFDADQFGEKVGMNNDGEVVTAPSSPFKIYFEWKINADGEYDVFCSIVTEDELEELLADTEEDEDEDEEEMNEEKKPPFEGPYSKTVAPKTEKKKHNEVAKLARRAIKKVKKKLEEDYEKEPADLSKKYAAYAKHEKALSKSNSLAAQLSPYYRKEMAKRSRDSKAISKRLAKKALTGMDEDYDYVRKAEAKDAGSIAKRARNPKEKKFWKKAHKDLSKDAVEGRMDESKDATKDVSKMLASKGKTLVRNKSGLAVLRKVKKLKEDYPGVQRRSNKTLDPDLQKKFKDYKSDQQARHSSNSLKMSYQNSPNQTFKTMGMVKPWKETDSRAKYDATRDKIVDTQNQREIRRNPPITVKEEQLNELHGKSREALKAIKARLEKKHDKEWEETYEKRKREKLKGGEKTKKEDKSRNDLAKRWLRADRAEKKLKDSKKK